jgi:glutamyl-tRNA reductase
MKIGLCLRFFMALSTKPLPKMGNYLSSRREAAEQAEEIIDTNVEHFLSWMKVQNVQSTIVDYRKQAEQLQQESLTKALAALQNGGNPEQIMQQLAHTLTNKLTHTPCVQLRKASQNDRHDLIAAAREIFKLQNQQ